VVKTFNQKGCPERILKLCQFAVSNGFFSWPQLKHADDPGEWDGAHAFSDAELEMLRVIARVGKQKPRWAR
jgi:hypothetical protein